MKVTGSAASVVVITDAVVGIEASVVGVDVFADEISDSLVGDTDSLVGTAELSEEKEAWPEEDSEFISRRAVMPPMAARMTIVITAISPV